MNADFVIVSYDCNFWAMAAVDALVDSLQAAGIDRAIYVVHNFKSTEQIEYFRTHCRRTTRPGAIRHAVAYEGVFEQVDNYADFTRQDVHWLIARHGMVLNWLIKYWLPDGRYFFLDHDCIVRAGFVQAMVALYPEIEGQLLVFPRHLREPRSLTGPMFYCDTTVRPLLANFCDTGWVSGIVRNERDRLRGGVELFYADGEIEAVIARSHFDDTLRNVVRYLLARWPDLVSRLSTVTWPECDHVWHGATRHLKRDQVAMLRRFLTERFRREHFRGEPGTSNVSKAFAERIRECGLAEEFRARMGWPAEDDGETLPRCP